MDQNTELDIIIPTYNGVKHLPRLLDSIAKQTYRNFNCFVVDDHSTDGTAQTVKKMFPWVQLIEQTENLGPAVNRNIAVAAGTSPFIIIFDDDTFLEDKDWFAKGLCCMENNQEVGQLAAMIVSGFEQDILLDCGILKNHYLFGGIFHNHDRRQVQGRHKQGRRILGACSAGTILRRDALELVGGFDGKYFYPAEDLDVSLRLHLAGYDVRYEPSLVVFHYESQAMGKSLSRKMYMYRRNCLLTLVENFPLIHVAKMFTAVWGREIFLPFLCYITGTISGKKKKENFPNSVTDYLKTFFFLLKNSVAIIKKRRTINIFRERPRCYLLQINEELQRELATGI